MSSEIRMRTGSPTTLIPTKTTTDITRTTIRLWRTRRITKTIRRCLLAFGHSRCEGVLVGSGLVAEPAAHRPGVHLVVQRDDPDVLDRDLRGAREQLGALLVVDSAKRLIDQLVDLLVGIAPAVRRPHALLAVERREQRLERRGGLAGARAPANQDEAELRALLRRPGGC